MKQPTNQQTDTDENITFMAEVIFLKILDSKNWVGRFKPMLKEHAIIFFLVVLVVCNSTEMLLFISYIDYW